ncbi:MAG: tetratricopeptide repeat protein [Magnetococcales bacterium]|nr:tetratricopeptide repeat protein [Magnetococcales bacterium]
MVADATKALGAVAAKENQPKIDSSITADDASRLEQILGGLGDEPSTTKGVDSQKAASETAKSRGKTRSLSETGKGPADGKQTMDEPGIPGMEKAGGEKDSTDNANHASSSGDAQNYAQSGEIKKKTLETSRTVSRLKSALAVGNNEEVDAGLSRLAASKGENNPFVMKMQAFMYMREGKYDQAGALLEEVLRNRKNDLDAAKNMVIVEMKTNRVPLAQERLKELLRRHPNDRQLRDLRQYLN